MIVVTKIFISVCHILGSVDIEILTLAISDSESISLSSLAVFAEVGTEQGSVCLSIEVLENLVVDEADSEKREELPAGCHLGEVANAANGLEAEPQTASPGENAVAVESLIQIREALTVLERHIV
jgi:hypothetical protein